MPVAAILRHVVSLALPPRCPGCGAVVEADHRFCIGCWQGLRFLGDPSCDGCGVPFAHAGMEGMRCGPCLRGPPAYGAARAAVAYGPVARDVVLKLKYGGRLGVARTLAGFMARRVPPDGDLLVPVPLHAGRIWQRGYNQSALIADGLGERCGIPVEKHALRRVRHTAPLRGMGHAERRRTLRGAFAVADVDRIAGRRIVLVDDVLTSGATADACARTLLSAGAGSVTLLCWARVLPGSIDD